MASTAALLVWNVVPAVFPTGSHTLLGSTPLTLIAVSLLIYQVAIRPPGLELLKAMLLAAAFLCWAANQLLPDLPQSLLLNDLAIALFVLDVFLLIVSRPPVLPGEDAAPARLPHQLNMPHAPSDGRTEKHVADAHVDPRAS